MQDSLLVDVTHLPTGSKTASHGRLFIVDWGTMHLCSKRQGVKLHRSKHMHYLGANLMYGAVEVWRQLEAWF